MGSRYFLSNKAVEDLSGIWEYTREVWSEKQADKYYNLLIDACTLIAENPKIGKLYNEIMEGLRALKMKKHLLFYVVLPSGDVEIVRILHERMDLKFRFSS